MTTTIDRTRAEYKVGAATVTVDSLLANAYGPLTDAQREALERTRHVLTAGTCTVYGADNGIHCGQPAGESSRCERHERRTR